MNFQDIILELKKFWSQKSGCTILHSYDEQVGAGTLSPFTTLGLLKNDTWNVCYEQYSRRPTDGRFGENPNRLSSYYQFQVIVKPYPQNITDLYIESLEHIGIKTKENDIRFVKDDWQNPSIGATGLGWEVWLNGMEITQFTYMKQVCGITLQTIPAEITYGLERLAMYIQNVDNVFDVQFSNDKKYGDIFKTLDVEYSYFYQVYANVENIFRYFNESEAEAKNLVEKKCYIPAYEQCLKASNYLNILDARGALSQNDRMSYILRVRNIVKQVAESMMKNG
jgi:glycyl-tRNA synthetase alpha chain